MSIIEDQTGPDGIHPNFKLLSHSSAVLLHKCPKKYELYKLLGKDGKQDDDEDGHLSFGDVVGYGVQDFLVHGDINHAHFSTFMRWKKGLDNEDGVKSRKTFWHALYAVDKFVGLRQTALSNYSLVTVNGKPAVELGFSIDLGHGFFYRGLLDELLYNNLTRTLEVGENKTTKYQNVHEANFKNSGQGLGYSLVLDAIAKKLGIEQGSSYFVKYLVYKTFGYEWEVFNFPKSHTERAMWIRNLLRDKQHIAEYANDEYFPMHGENCYDFFRPCPYFGTCTISRNYLVPNPKVQVEAEDKYPFKFSLEELIAAQLAS